MIASSIILMDLTSLIYLGSFFILSTHSNLSLILPGLNHEHLPHLLPSQIKWLLPSDRDLAIKNLINHSNWNLYQTRQALGILITQAGSDWTRIPSSDYIHQNLKFSMPKVPKNRLSNTHSLAPGSLSRRPFSLPDGHSQRLNQEILSISANEILKKLDDPKAFISSARPISSLPKLNNHSSFRNQDSQVPHPYSKSHIKRLKKKIRNQSVLGDLNLVKQSLEEIETTQSDSTAYPIKHTKISQTTPSAGLNPTRSNQVIHDSKPKKSLTQKQRAKILSEESSRLPNILKNPEFQKNPFAAIRIHAQNTLALSSSSTPST
ncbi:hypothetical protein O181_084445 [Austropuccinia psidii MF-1]|uniref:Ribosome biogenesis protein SLX9 n=1 Tax=Austropuccinia psidii MF-1 TaxID=1389203 RepID=A0A9Q3FVN0_9BASI|nr:hypothetical protein [Austropuccinia psidii MF-1]